MLRPRMGKGMVGSVRAGSCTGQAERARSPSWGPVIPSWGAYPLPPPRLPRLASPRASRS